MGANNPVNRTDPLGLLDFAGTDYAPGTSVPGNPNLPRNPCPGYTMTREDIINTGNEYLRNATVSLYFAGGMSYTAFKLVENPYLEAADLMVATAALGYSIGSYTGFGITVVGVGVGDLINGIRRGNGPMPGFNMWVGGENL